MWHSALFVSDTPLLIGYSAVVHVTRSETPHTDHERTISQRTYTMDNTFCRRSQNDDLLFWVEIADVGGGASILYVVNGGRWPPNPTVGNFAYDLSSLALKVYYPEGWRDITIADIESLVWHPAENRSVVNVTRGGLPFWNPVSSGDEESRRPCKFQTVEGLVSHFQRTFDNGKIKVTNPSSTSVLGSENGTLEAMCIDDEQAVGYPFSCELA